MAYAITATRNGNLFILVKENNLVSEWEPWNGNIPVEAFMCKSITEAQEEISRQMLSSRHLGTSVDQNSIKISEVKITFSHLENIDVSEFVVKELLKKLTNYEKTALANNIEFFTQELNKNKS